MKTTIINTVTFELTAEEMTALLMVIGVTSVDSRIRECGMSHAQSELVRDIYADANTTLNTYIKSL